mmetsp:Transcript_23078/g.56928  ORF Transcript_23078/g.56928 Transcript_23078/m.56928 type:complete len:86 (-) Transcript_23078:58-315(-)
MRIDGVGSGPPRRPNGVILWRFWKHVNAREELVESNNAAGRGGSLLFKHGDSDHGIVCINQETSYRNNIRQDISVDHNLKLRHQN